MKVTQAEIWGKLVKLGDHVNVTIYNGHFLPDRPVTEDFEGTVISMNFNCLLIADVVRNGEVRILANKINSLNVLRRAGEE